MRGLMSCAQLVAGLVGALVGAPTCLLAQEWAGSTRDSLGVEIVSNDGRPMWAAADRWSLSQYLLIGPGSDAEGYRFERIGGNGIAVGADGRIFVLGAMAQDIKVFSADGQFLSALGGPGAGPGELGSGAEFLLRALGDTLYVPDLQQGRVSLYHSEAGSAGSFRLDVSDGVPFVWGEGGDGTLIAQKRATPGSSATPGQDALVRMDGTGALLDTVLAFPSAGVLTFAGNMPRVHMFAPTTVWSVSPDGLILLASTDRYEIRYHAADGSLERIVRNPSSRVPVGPSDREAALESLTRAWEEAGVPRGSVQALLATVSFSDLYPAFARALFGPGGTTWVQHVNPIGELSAEEKAEYDVMSARGSALWDVFDPDGRFLGTLTMPPRFEPSRFMGDRLLGVGRDEFDVQHVAGYTVEPTRRR